MRTKIIGLAEVAELLGITTTSARTYHGRAQKNRRLGKHTPANLPAPDYTIGGRPAWNQRTIQMWMLNRPGRGVRTDL